MMLVVRVDFEIWNVSSQVILKSLFFLLIHLYYIYIFIYLVYVYTYRFIYDATQACLI